MYVVQSEGNVVYCDVCLRYTVREIFLQRCVSEVLGEENVEYSDVCVRYRVIEMLCTVMCV